MGIILYEVWACYDDADNCEKIASFFNRAAAEQVKNEYEKSTEYSNVWINEIYERIDSYA